MNIGIQRIGNIHKIDVDGRLDLAGTSAIGAAFANHCASKPNVVVDLSRVNFIGSSGIRLLVAGAQAQSRIGGRMVLFGPDDMARRILKTTGTEKLIPIVESLEEAVATLAAAPGQG